jgi:thiol-disulfide isomerase/thioredoxin
MTFLRMMKHGAALAVLTISFPVLAATAPRIGEVQLKQPLPLPYDVTADADAQVAAAKRLAKAHHTLLLIDLGGNWCLDCRVLAGVLEVPAVAAFVQRHYEVVKVDIGRMDKNQQVAAHYGITDVHGVPALMIVDPRKDRLINRGRISALSDARSMTPQALADWLAQWVA